MQPRPTNEQNDPHRRPLLPVDLDITLDRGPDETEPSTRPAARAPGRDRRTLFLVVAGIASFVWGFAFMLASALLF